MSDGFDPEIMQIAGEIQIYLEDHPMAADTAEGIKLWWFLRQRFELSSGLVQQALDYLVATSVLEHNTNLSGQKIYASKKQKP